MCRIFYGIEGNNETKLGQRVYIKEFAHTSQLLQ